MGKNQQYAMEHSEEAMAQMRKYGIPASVILAQGIIESSNGQSELSRLGNNHFGVKATPKWLAEGGQYLVYTDDKPNEKFCSYASVAESYEHHSQFLKENSRYVSLFKLSPDDYAGWCDGLQAAGYASGKNYAANLKSIIDANGLDRYDQEVMKTGGVEHQRSAVAAPVSHYAFPLESKEFMLVTSPFGMRTDPMDPSKQQMHKGVDIRCDHQPLLATEDNGKVVAVNANAKTGGGKSVTMEYDHGKDGKVQVTYMHMDSIDVKVGDVVKAGEKVGISGNAGTRTTGPHLHMGVKTFGADGTSRDIDPASYLADIAVKGNISQQVLYNGENLLAKYQPAVEPVKQDQTETEPVDQNLSPEDWMKKLLSSEDAGIGMGGDGLMLIIIGLFSSLMALALQIDNRESSREEQMSEATEAALDRRIDLTSMLKGVDHCELVLNDGGKPQLHVVAGETEASRELSPAEIRNLTSALQNTALSDEEKRQRVSSIVSQMVMQQRMSHNFDQQLDADRSMSETMQIR